MGPLIEVAPPRVFEPTEDDIKFADAIHASVSWFGPALADQYRKLYLRSCVKKQKGLIH